MTKRKLSAAKLGALEEARCAKTRKANSRRTLINLPQEVFNVILRSCDVRALKGLREACSHTELKTTAVFRKRARYALSLASQDYARLQHFLRSPTASAAETLVIAADPLEQHQTKPFISALRRRVQAGLVRNHVLRNVTIQLEDYRVSVLPTLIRELASIATFRALVFEVDMLNFANVDWAFDVDVFAAAHSTAAGTNITIKINDILATIATMHPNQTQSAQAISMCTPNGSNEWFRFTRI